jgi:hypothetical protein
VTCPSEFGNDLFLPLFGVRGFRQYPWSDVNRALLLCCAILMLLAGFGGKAATGQQLAGVSVTVDRFTYSVYPNTDPPVDELFSLTCDPPVGTMPFAARLCADIAKHPIGMLTPVSPASGACSVNFSAAIASASGAIPAFLAAPGSPRGGTQTRLTVSVQSGGETTELPGGCAAGPAYFIYLAAAANDEATIAELEPELVCEEGVDALALESDLPFAAEACLSGAWTAANARLIRIAEQAPAIAALDPAQLFTAEPGTRLCKLAGTTSQCGVWVAGSAVSFAVDWSGHPITARTREPGGLFVLPPPVTQADLWSPPNESKRDVWWLLVENGRVGVVSRQGP